MRAVPFCSRAVPAPSFALAQLPKKAELTICGLGFYELYINGEQVTKGLLSPYISNPDDLLYYDSYDLAPYLQVGENVIGLQLGNGMQNAFGGYVWDFEKGGWRSAAPRSRSAWRLRVWTVQRRSLRRTNPSAARPRRSIMTTCAWASAMTPGRKFRAGTCPALTTAAGNAPSSLRRPAGRPGSVRPAPSRPGRS